MPLKPSEANALTATAILTAASDWDGWTPVNLRALRDGYRTRDSVGGMKFGPFALFRRKGRDYHELYHVPSDRMVVLCREAEDCRRVAELLWEECCLAFRKGTEAEVRDAAPHWVGPWCRAVTKALGWLDPYPYRLAAPPPRDDRPV